MVETLQDGLCHIALKSLSDHEIYCWAPKIIHIGNEHFILKRYQDIFSDQCQWGQDYTQRFHTDAEVIFSEIDRWTAMHTDMLCIITDGDSEKFFHGIISFGHVTHKSRTDDKINAIL